MGLVKYGQQTLNIDVVPDGHVIVPESEYLNLKNILNAHLGLKSKIPPGIEEEKLTLTLDKGIHYDELENKYKQLQAQAREYEQKLNSYMNIPKDFNIDKWNYYVAREKAEIRQAKIKELTNRVLEDVKSKTGVTYEIDERFINKEAYEKFDPDSDNAFEEWYKILDDAHTEQQNFLKKFVKDKSLEPIDISKTELDIKPTHPKDVVSDGKIIVGRIGI